MQKLIIHRLFLVLILLSGMVASSNALNAVQEKSKKNATGQIKEPTKFKVTFIELGSVRCIPCKQMQTVMKSIDL